MKPGWVYILECADDSYYTGSTSQLETRLGQHQQGIYDGYTARRRPVKLRWSHLLPDIRQAIELERQIKGWSRKKKEAVMNGDIDLLHELAQSKEMRERRKRRENKTSR
ncbi:MAG: GIY-YIG nuclease family protein [Bacteroidota bacterium]